MMILLRKKVSGCARQLLNASAFNISSQTQWEDMRGV
jgi:hypothetical protein